MDGDASAATLAGPGMLGLFDIGPLFRVAMFHEGVCGDWPGAGAEIEAADAIGWASRWGDSCWQLPGWLWVVW